MLSLKYSVNYLLMIILDCLPYMMNIRVMTNMKLILSKNVPYRNIQVLSDLPIECFLLESRITFGNQLIWLVSLKVIVYYTLVCKRYLSNFLHIVQAYIQVFIHGSFLRECVLFFPESFLTIMNQTFLQCCTNFNGWHNIIHFNG